MKNAVIIFVCTALISNNNIFFCSLIINPRILSTVFSFHETLVFIHHCYLYFVVITGARQPLYVRGLVRTPATAGNGARGPLNSSTGSRVLNLAILMQ